MTVTTDGGPGVGATSQGPAVRVATTGRLRGEVRVPGDKSIAHRALLFNAMGEGEAAVLVRHPGADVRSTVGALRTLGALTAATSEEVGLIRFSVRGGGTARTAILPGTGGEQLDCGNSGTSMRLLAGALAGRAAGVELGGDDSGIIEHQNIARTQV